MIAKGEVVVYRCRGLGLRHLAEVRAVGRDGRVDLAVDAGCSERVELTRVGVVALRDLAPGTCSNGGIDGEESGEEKSGEA